MPIEVIPYTDAWLNAVRAFNTRMQAGGMATQMENDRRFGSLRVGSIVDVLAAPRDAEAASPELQKATEPFDETRQGLHLTNMDGHGPMRL